MIQRLTSKQLAHRCDRCQGKRPASSGSGPSAVVCQTPRVTQRATMRDVAERAGTSRTTAHYVLTGQDRDMRIAEETRCRVLRAANELDYRPNLMARGLRTRVSRTIALITDTVASAPYAGGFVHGALAAAAQRGYLLFMCETGEDPSLEQQLLGELLDRHVDGFVYATLFTREVELPEALGSQRVVLLNCRTRDGRFPAVVPDERAAGRAAATALLDAGHREGIWLAGEPNEQVIAAAERLQGIQAVLAEAGTELAGVVDSRWWPESAYEEFGAVLDAGAAPRAVICLNDRVARRRSARRTPPTPSRCAPGAPGTARCSAPTRARGRSAGPGRRAGRVAGRRTARRRRRA